MNIFTTDGKYFVFVKETTQRDWNPSKWVWMGPFGILPKTSKSIAWIKILI